MLLLNYCGLLSNKILEICMYGAETGLVRIQKVISNKI